jgi:hypothetical protein
MGAGVVQPPQIKRVATVMGVRDIPRARAKALVKPSGTNCRQGADLFLAGSAVSGTVRDRTSRGRAGACRARSAAVRSRADRGDRQHGRFSPASRRVHRLLTTGFPALLARIAQKPIAALTGALWWAPGWVESGVRRIVVRRRTGCGRRSGPTAGRRGRPAGASEPRPLRPVRTLGIYAPATRARGGERRLAASAGPRYRVEVGSSRGRAPPISFERQHGLQNRLPALVPVEVDRRGFGAGGSTRSTA